MGARAVGHPVFGAIDIIVVAIGDGGGFLGGGVGASAWLGERECPEFRPAGQWGQNLLLLLFSAELFDARTDQ